ncbi:MAG: PTS sugar transporter subunit IIB, partial [Leclercia sp.]
MFRIMLCCSAGMSTSMLVRKMVEEAETRGLPVKIDAYGVAEFDTQFPNYQVVLLGPQVKYMLTTLSEKAATQGVPVKA